MSKEKLKATPVYDEELESWIINVDIEGKVIPIGKTISEKLGLFEYSKFESEEKAKEWLDKRSYQFYY